LWLQTLLLLVGLLAFLCSFGDRGWFEGDSIALVDAMVNFEAKGGADGAYRYPWQPLTYELGAALAPLVSSPRRLLLLPHLLGAVSLVLLTWAVHLASLRNLPLLVAFALVALFPELLYTGLYLNSTAFAMVPMSAAILLLVGSPGPLPAGRDRGWVRPLLVGVLVGVACLCRLDFALGLPLLLTLAASRWGVRRGLLPSLLGCGVLGVLAFAAGAVTPAGLLEVLAAHRTSVQVNEFGAARTLQVFTTATHWTVWVLLLLGALLSLSRSVRRREWSGVLVLASGLPLLWPLTGLMSPKYLVPLMLFLPLALATWAAEAALRRPGRATVALGAVIVLVSLVHHLVSLEVDSRPPHLVCRLEPTVVGTHDGPRTVGAWLRGYQRVRSAPQRQIGWAFVGHRVADHVTRSLRSCDVAVLVPNEDDSLLKGSRTWGYFANTVIFLQLADYELVSTRLRFDQALLRGQDHIVRVVPLPAARCARDQPSPVDQVVIRLPYIPVGDPTAKVAIRAFLAELKAQRCAGAPTDGGEHDGTS